MEAKSSYSSKQKKKYQAVLTAQFMSSEEEDNAGGFIVRPPSWESDEFRKVKRQLDEKYSSMNSSVSKRMLANRRTGPVAPKVTPTTTGVEWIVADQSNNE